MINQLKKNFGSDRNPDVDNGQETNEPRTRTLSGVIFAIFSVNCRNDGSCRVE